MALLNLFLAFFYISFILGEVIRFRIIGAVTAGPMDFAVLFLFIYWIFKVKKNKYKLLKPIVIFSLIALFSLTINFINFSGEQIFTSFLYLLRWIFYSSIYFIFRDIGKEQVKKIDKYILYSGLTILAIGFVQLIFFPSLKSLYYLGWDDHMYRITSSFLDPNFAGIVLVLFFIFVFFLRNELFGKNKNISYIILTLIFLGIVLTYSRGAFLMFTTSALVYSVVKREWRVIAGAIFSMVIVFIILSPRFYLENTNLLRTVSTEHRIATVTSAIKIFQENPMGVGFNTYRYAREKYGEKDISKFGPSHSGAGVDNSLVLVLVTTGFLGFGAYLYLLYKTLRIGFYKFNNKYGLILVASLVGVVVNSLTINSLFYSFIMLWVWMLAGLTESN